MPQSPLIKKNKQLISCVFKLKSHEYKLAGRKFVIGLF